MYCFLIIMKSILTYFIYLYCLKILIKALRVEKKNVKDTQNKFEKEMMQLAEQNMQNIEQNFKSIKEVL